jgi:hypothetical protein
MFMPHEEDSRTSADDVLDTQRGEVAIYVGTAARPAASRAFNPVGPPPPAIIAGAGPNAGFAWEEFFQGEIANAHTRKNYAHAVQRFLDWAEGKNVELLDITPGLVGTYFQELEAAIPTK